MLVDAIANKGDPNGGVTYRLVGIFEADLSGDDMLGMKVTGLDMGYTAGHFGPCIDAADP